MTEVPLSPLLLLFLFCSYSASPSVLFPPAKVKVGCLCNLQLPLGTNNAYTPLCQGSRPSQGLVWPKKNKKTKKTHTPTPSVWTNSLSMSAFSNTHTRQKHEYISNTKRAYSKHTYVTSINKCKSISAQVGRNYIKITLIHVIFSHFLLTCATGTVTSKSDASVRCS